MDADGPGDVLVGGGGSSDPLIPTFDPRIFIEEIRPGYVRYQDEDGRRWEVHGTCQHWGFCLVGGILPDGTMITSPVHARQLKAWEILNPENLDWPVTPEFTGCCPFTFVELDPVK